MKPLVYLLATAGLVLAGCGGGAPEETEAAEPTEVNRNPFPSTYTPYPSATTLIKDATVLDGLGGMIEELPLPLVENTGLELVLVTEVADGDLVDEMSPQDGGLLVRGEVSTLTLGHRDSSRIRIMDQVGVAFQQKQYRRR